jgi:radical SAM superfamily enzyme YgiQ (UPF0313 family)
VRILLVSAYELGHQPIHLASPAAALRAAGHEVRAHDLAVERLDDALIDWADRVAISVPMHTAMRLATDLVALCRRRRPDLPIALYGLYAGMSPGIDVDAMLVGEYEPDLVRWVTGGNAGGLSVRLDRGSFRVPERDLLPPLTSYAHLQVGDRHRVVGYVEASHGCRHRCRHCPIPAVYEGRYRIVGRDVVVADALNQAELGAEHITFGDPDFLNGPTHAMAVLEEIHRSAPDLTFDITVKVEHLLRHRDLVHRMRRLGVLFVISAFETTHGPTLQLLDKGHTPDDMGGAVEVCRDAGLDVHPSWMPFVPWTTPAHVVDIFRFLDRHDLFAVTDPVQMSIRLLIPPGSLMVEIPEIARAIGPLDPLALTHPWQSDDPRADELQRRLAALAEGAAMAGADPQTTLAEQWRVALEISGGEPSEAQIPAGAVDGRPRMTEPWFC